MKQTVKYASFRHNNNGEVRHLLIDRVEGQAHCKLILFTDSIETELFSGTEYESQQQADQLGREWIENGGFELAKEDHPAFEALRPTVQLAIRLGYDTMFEPSQFPRAPRISLKDWQGLQGKNGGAYKYAITSTGIRANPTLPAGFVAKIDQATFAQDLLTIHKAQETVGSPVEYLFLEPL